MSNDMQGQIDDIRATLREIASAQGYNQQQISELRSTVSTLAEIAGVHDRQIEQLIQTQQESQQRFDRFVEQANQDRALMLKLIQQLAQGRNGGN